MPMPALKILLFSALAFTVAPPLAADTITPCSGLGAEGAACFSLSHGETVNFTKGFIRTDLQATNHIAVSFGRDLDCDGNLSSGEAAIALYGDPSGWLAVSLPDGQPAVAGFSRDLDFEISRDGEECSMLLVCGNRRTVVPYDSSWTLARATVCGPPGNPAGLTLDWLKFHIRIVSR